ncbi:MAG: hypothetical protein Q9174_005117 [Haloplaca sp. 1 TL-2023]
MADIQRYQISVSHEARDLIQKKLALSSLPDELDDAAWDYGAPLEDIKRLVRYWQDKYDWRIHEKRMNALPQYHTSIPVKGFDDLDVHFVNQKSPAADAIPLLFVHGWPGSFLEVTKILPLLANTKEGEPAFHIVAPSLTNFGFSEGVKKKGFALPQYAEVCHNLMLRLGYNEYVTQAGDWGTLITRSIGYFYPDHCKATHINGVPNSPPSFTRNPITAVQNAITPYTEGEKAGNERRAWFKTEGMGYSSMQGTKPQTIGYALADSPVGLLAWIYEKLHDWTDSYPWTDDEILTWVCIYLFSRAGPAASARIYYEAGHNRDEALYAALGGYIPQVKLGLAYFPKDLLAPPPRWADVLGPVAYKKAHEKGGHFAAYEQPEAIAGDLKKMFGKGGGAFGVVPGKDGMS